MYSWQSWQYSQSEVKGLFRDAVKSYAKNEEYLNCPTFIPEKGQSYANEIQMLPPVFDPLE
jgi:hypothetical protein